MRNATGTAVLLGVLALSACTPDPVAPAPSPTPPVSQSPTETAQERQERLDYAAAEKSYRTFRAEYNRVLRAGGAEEPTKVMKATAGGSYLSELSEIAEAYEGLGIHATGREQIGYVRRGGYSDNTLGLEVCEDSRNIKDIDRNGKVKGRGEVRTASIEVKETEAGWKLWSGEGVEVDSCT